MTVQSNIEQGRFERAAGKARKRPQVYGEACGNIYGRGRYPRFRQAFREGGISRSGVPPSSIQGRQAEQAVRGGARGGWPRHVPGHPELVLQTCLLEPVS